MSPRRRIVFITISIGVVIASAAIVRETRIPRGSDSAPYSHKSRDISQIPKESSWQNLLAAHKIVDCAKPLELRIGQVDAEFKLDTVTLEKAVKSAAEEWNHATGHMWFRLSNTEGIPVNLLFDGRQENIEERKLLQQYLDTEAAQSRTKATETFERVLAMERHVSLWSQERADYDARVSAYNDEVRRLEGSGYVDGHIRETLEREERDLVALEDRLKKSAARLNRAIKSHKDKLEEVRREEEERVARIRALGERYPSDRISEAEHRTGPFVNEINVYAFTDEENLHVILLHEMGHAIGLEHSNVSEAIMAPVNQSGVSSSHLTATDIAAARATCPNP
jgi:hypothetical protein